MTHASEKPEPTSTDVPREIPATDFVATVLDVDALAPGDKPEPHWWAESDNGRCSEVAALFAASQPAPLSVV